MVYKYTLKQIVRSAWPPPRHYQSRHPVAAGQTIEAEDGNYYFVVSASSGNPEQLNVGPDGTSPEEAELLARQLGLIK